APGFQACAATVESVRTSYRDGGTLRGGRYTVRRIIVDGFFSPDRTVVVGVVFDRSPLSAIGGDGAVLTTQPGTTFNSCQVLLARVQGHWQVVEQLCGNSAMSSP